MERLVAAKPHAQVYPQASTQKRRTEQYLLGDAPKIFLGFAFVCNHKAKAQRIDYE